MARQNGPRAGLFVAAAGIMTTSRAVEPGMYAWGDAFGRAFADVGITVLFAVLAPILVCRCRSRLGRVLGLVLPVTGYAAAFALALHSAHSSSALEAAATAGPVIALAASARAVESLHR